MSKKYLFFFKLGTYSKTKNQIIVKNWFLVLKHFRISVIFFSLS